MVEPWKGRQGFSARNVRAEARQYEIDRFRQWYINRHYTSVPEGFAWKHQQPIDHEDVDRAVRRFLTHGYRYPHYPYSN